MGFSRETISVSLARAKGSALIVKSQTKYPKTSLLVNFVSKGTFSWSLFKHFCLKSKIGETWRRQVSL